MSSVASAKSLVPVSPVQLEPALALVPGTVVDATVQKVLQANLVRILLAGVSLNVVSEVPLEAGQTLRLAVSQTPDGLRLQMTGQPGQVSQSGAGSATTGATATGAAVSTSAPAISAGSPALAEAQARAVTAAVQTAATRQGSLSPLFANVLAAASAGALPPDVQRAVAQLLAFRLPLDQGVDAAKLKAAFQSSGLFMETRLASESGNVPVAPDLKSVLLVLRQALANVVSAALEKPAQAAPPLVPGDEPPNSMVPARTSQNPSIPSVPSNLIAALVARGGTDRNIANFAQLLALAHDPPGQIATPVGVRPGETVLLKALVDQGPLVHTTVPPPPFRGGSPAPQPVADPTVNPQAQTAEIARQLLDDTDAAIARQTLLQVASLPDRPDAVTGRTEMNAPRWNFEIPLATPQGTAMAQFEISRDGGGLDGVDAPQRIWRAKFSLDVEPNGPVHAMIALAGERASVRMWAERPATAERLRSSADQLAEALREAHLEPGDIVIGEGVPAAPAPLAGHFLDRAL